MVYKVFFSPTGGTKRCLDIIAGDAEEIDISRKHFSAHYSFSPDDVLYIALPSFGGRCPQEAIKRLRFFSGNGAKAVLVAVYGNRAYEDTLIELYDNAKESGFKVMAAVSAVAEHSMFRDIAAGRPDSKDRSVLTAFRAKIMEKLKSNDGITYIPGNRPYKEIGKFLIPEAGKECIRCAKCYNACPVDAIDEMRPNLTDENRCIACARCIAICPMGIRGYGREALDSVRKRISQMAGERKEAELFV